MFRRIMVVLDDHVAAQSALRQGVELARVHRAELLFLYLLPKYLPSTAEASRMDASLDHEVRQEIRKAAALVLADAAAFAERSEVFSQGTMGGELDAVRDIVDQARKRRCDLIVVASEGRNAVMRLISGSVIPGLITASRVPVMVCHFEASDPPSHGRGTALARGSRHPRGKDRGWWDDLGAGQ